MVDAEDLGFLKIVGECTVQGLRRLQVVPDRFLDDDSRPFPVGREARIVEEPGISPNKDGGVAM
jgi:hypothetical protein